MIKRKDFGVIIISHGRPECETVKTLKESGYTGKTYIVVDDEDVTLPKYIELYGDNVHVFHKTDDFDLGDLGGTNRVGVYARNECLKVARAKGLKYYCNVDDDMKSLNFRYNDEGHLKGKKITNLDAVIEGICELFDNSTIQCFGFGNAVDYIGGVQTFENAKVNPKIMNAFFLRTDNDAIWRGRYSDDQIFLLTEAVKGSPVFKFTPVQQLFDVWIPKRKSNLSGGAIDAYNAIGSYKMRFYLFMFFPSCVSLRQTADGFDNTIITNNAFPKILSYKAKKTR